MDNEIKTNVILDWKMGEYSRNKLDYVAPQELTVTITLNEYRNLVKEVATKRDDIDKANNEKWKREAEITELKKENAELKSKLFDIMSYENDSNGEE